jgi:hypothetical protein
MATRPEGPHQLYEYSIKGVNYSAKVLSVKRDMRVGGGETEEYMVTCSILNHPSSENRMTEPHKIKFRIGILYGEIIVLHAQPKRGKVHIEYVPKYNIGFSQVNAMFEPQDYEIDLPSYLYVGMISRPMFSGKVRPDNFLNERPDIAERIKYGAYMRVVEDL